MTNTTHKQFARIEAHRMSRPLYADLAGGALIGERRPDGVWWRWEGGADWAHGIERRTVAEVEDALHMAWLMVRLCDGLEGLGLRIVGVPQGDRVFYAEPAACPGPWVYEIEVGLKRCGVSVYRGVVDDEDRVDAWWDETPEGLVARVARWRKLDGETCGARVEDIQVSID